MVARKKEFGQWPGFSIVFESKTDLPLSFVCNEFVFHIFLQVKINCDLLGVLPVVKKK